MSDTTGQLHGRWTHSAEEDHDGILVYRPADYAFPPARGRDGIEFRSDGSYVDWAIGRGDAGEARPGRWQSVSGGRVQVSTAAGEQRVLDLIQVASDRLEIRLAGPR